MKRVKPTQREIVLKTLQERGDKGVHSFEFYHAGLPRFAARICELREEGWEIKSEHEVFNGTAEGCRYKLQAQCGPKALAKQNQDAGVEDNPGGKLRPQNAPDTGGPDSPRCGVADQEVPAAAPEELSLFPETSRPSLVDADQEWAA